MALVRKKSVNKRFLGEVSPGKDLTMNRKKKLSELGPQWTTMELHRFYKAFRVHGKSWKKVASEVRNRSTEMVEALYNMNRAYLSHPEGTASVHGLVAIMTDHYSSLEEVESEEEGDNSPELVQISKKRRHNRIEISTSNADVNHFQSSASTNGRLLLLKKACLDGGLPRMVGRRTPRVKTSCHNKDDVNSASIKKKGLLSDIDDKDKVACVAALALTKASNIGCPHRGSRLLPRKELSEDTFESKDVAGDVNGHPRAITSSSNFEGLGNVGFFNKRKFYGSEVRDKENGTYLSDNEGEACRSTEVKRRATLLGTADNDVSNLKCDKSFRGDERIRYKKMLSRDELLALDALQTLANLSVTQSESSSNLKEERASIRLDDKSSIPGTIPGGHDREASSEDEPLSSFQGIQGYYTRKQKFGRRSANFKPAQLLQSVSLNSSGRKIKDEASELQLPNPEPPMDSQHTKSLETVASNEKETKSLAKLEQTSDLSRQFKPTMVNGALTAQASIFIAGSTEPAAVWGEVILSTSKRSRIKADMKRALMHKGRRSSEKILKNESDNLLNGKELNLEEKFSCCLSSPMVQRWCYYEWFYNAIDYPWFANKEFVEYLNHVGLGHVPRLTRVEWGVIRSSLGKPRRFSHRFLYEEREKLKQYRESVRTHYSELHRGDREGLPTDLAKPLLVGQRVTAVHPKTRELHDGSVLAVECDKCRLQFDRPRLGVESVEDIDCMPSNPMDNMPEALRMERLLMKEHSKTSLTSFWQQENRPSPLKTPLSQQKVEELHFVPLTKAAGADATTAQQESCFRHLVTQVRAMEDDRKTFLELTCSYDMQASAVAPSSRQHSAHQGFTSSPTWLKVKPASGSVHIRGGPSYSTSAAHLQESGSPANDIIRMSRSRADIMVDTAVHAFSGTDKGEDAYRSTRKALDWVDSSNPGAAADDVNDQRRHGTSQVRGGGGGLEGGGGRGSSGCEASIPSELITSCIASLITIQACCEEQYPPEQVAEAIDAAVGRLLPCCPQNLSLYRDIQMCIGRIKLQIFSLLPPSSSFS